MAYVESENFAINSNMHFLFLIGKFASQSKQCSEEGLKALNDYLLILDHIRYNLQEKDYLRKRALAQFQVGLILYNERDITEALTYLQIA